MLIFVFKARDRVEIFRTVSCGKVQSAESGLKIA